MNLISSNIIREGFSRGRNNDSSERPKGDVGKLDAIQNKLERIIKEVTGLGIRQGGAGRYDHQEEIENILQKVSNAIGYRAEEIEEYDYERGEGF